ncbi:hypothetical protein SBADM41S_03115 [Streptomyces badius]
MLTSTANRDSHPPLPSFWPRVRRFAVPASMIETATARREAGDWAGACAAARVDVDLQLRSVASSHGRELAACIRADLRHLAPDLLRWHLPRIAPHGLLRPGLTIELARYDPLERDGPALCTWSSGPHPPGRTPDSGSVSRCGTGRTPSPPPDGTPTRIRTAASVSICTATCGMRAEPMSCDSAPVPTACQPNPLMQPLTRTCGAPCRRTAAVPSTGGRRRRRPCSGRRGRRGRSREGR